MKKNQKGITLVSMVITIIVMLILAGVSISAAIGDDGVATRGSQAAVKTKLATVEEDFNLAVTNLQMEYETVWANSSSISAYKGVFLTYEKLNEQLKESKVLVGKDVSQFITANFNKTQKDLCGKKGPTVTEIENTCYTEEHPISQLAFSSTTPTLTELKGSIKSNKKDLCFAMYLSNGKNGNELGDDLYIAICSLEDGNPILIDLGLVESDINSSAVVNGPVQICTGEKNPKNGEIDFTNQLGDGGNSTYKTRFPMSVTWLNNARGLKNLENGTVK